MRVNTPLGSVDGVTHTETGKCEQICFFCYWDHHSLCVNKDCKCKLKKMPVNKIGEKSSS